MLEAARACVLAVGVRRTTFSDVARRAGVSRMTLYRRFPDLETLLSTLMTWEFGRVVDEARAGRRRPAAAASARWRWSRRAARRLHADPLFDRLLDVDPELLLPYVTRPARRDAAAGGRRPRRRARGRPRRRLGARRRRRGARARDRADRARVRARPRPRPRRLGRARARRRRVPAAMTGASLNAARRAAELDALAVRRGGRPRRRRRRDHRRRRRARRRLARAVGRAARAPRPRARHEPLELQARPRRPALPRAPRVGPGLGVRARARAADGHDRAAPRAPAAVRDPARRAACRPRRRRRRRSACGSATGCGSARARAAACSRRRAGSARSRRAGSPRRWPRPACAARC